MIRYQITGANPIEVNTAAKVLVESPRLELEKDTGNRNGRKEGYIRYIHVRIKQLRKRKRRPEPRLSATQRRQLAEACWDRIVFKTDSDVEAVQAIIELIEHVERKYL